MHTSFAAISLAAIVWSLPAYAGEEPLYDKAPDWVEEADVPALITQDGPADILYDRQIRLEKGLVTDYSDAAYRIDNPASLQQLNTQTISWLPDKGDLTIHRFEIYRDGEVIDLVADGVRFEMLRREQGLEQRILDGELTATVSVPGLREGDVLRLAFSVTLSDQALGDHVQALEYLPSEPWQVGKARAIVSWPENTDIYWDVEDRVQLAEPERRDGYRWLSVDLPLAEADTLPTDAPYRYNRLPVLRVGSFGSWEELSAVMTPHFEAAAQLLPGSPVAAEAARIMAATDDPRQRAADAVRLVQDEVSYLLDGLDGGNYLPQSAEETWSVRYGDCKAKSVLLLALLREMGITAETVLVHSSQGDAVPELLPLPGAFDHMIVRAEIDGVTYWLDGTSTATRIASLTDVPPFHHALPLRDGGAGLVRMEQRDLAQPQMAMHIAVDHSAGLDWPVPVTMTMAFSGPSSAQIQAIADADNPDLLRGMAQQFSAGQDMLASNIAVSYDDDLALGTIRIDGLALSNFEWRDGRLRVDNIAPTQVSFNPDRSRAAWREIPVATPGPSRTLVEATVILPQNGEGFSIDGDAEFSADIANMRFESSNTITNGVVTGRVESFQMLGEVPAAEVPALKRAARRYGTARNELVPPENLPWRWELTAAERAERAQPVLAVLDEAFAFADEDDLTPRYYRLWFFQHIYDFAAALPDMNAVIEAEATPSQYVERSFLHRATGNAAAALEDLWTAYDLEPSGANGRELAEFLALTGDVTEAMAIMEELPVPEDEKAYHTYVTAVILAQSGDVAAGDAMMADMIAGRLQDSDALNLDCWYRGLYSLRLDSAVDRCTQAIERAEFAASALDSRALVHFRRGDYAAAIADLDAALMLSPEMAAARYLRGVVRLHAGDAGGAEDLRHGLLMVPHLGEEYARFGIAPPA